MPARIAILTPEGLQPAPYHADSLKAAAAYEPEQGIYTVTNTFQRTQVLKLDAHLDRLEDSARRAGIALALDRPRLRAALREMIAAADFGDVRFRITVSAAQPQHFILTLEPFQPVAPALIAQGVRAITAANSARHNAAAKTTDWMHARAALEAAMPPGIYDTFLLDADGYVLEGLASNVYGVLAGELRTAGAGVLPGIAQQIVLAVAPPRLPVRREAFHVREVARLEEAFLTSSSRGIIPVVEIDGQRIGAGVPGPHTLALRQAYQDWLHRHLEEL
ncbi:MAG: aminotransferase class IV [Anaerolineae bacterium]|nr:aminotransferase class IV [Anaerolineae bacterium]